MEELHDTVGALSSYIHHMFPTIGDVSAIGSVFRAVWVLVLAIVGEHCTGLAILLIALKWMEAHTI
jgi:hypothetical protein